MGRLRACLFACTIAAQLTGLSHAAAEFPAADDDWIRIDTTNFTLYGNTTQGATRRIARDLEKFRQVLRLLYDRLPERSPVPTFVYVFKSDQSFTPYKPLSGGKPREVAGVFHHRRDGDYISMTVAAGIEARRLIYHEFMHQVFADQLPRIPVWFSEGMAEAYSTFEADEDSAAVGKTIPDHVHVLRGMPMMPLRELLDVTYDSPVYNEGERRGIFYAESWSLVHYLLWGAPERKQQLGDYLDRLARGTDPASAFASSFGADPDELEGELRAYINEGRYYYSRVEFDRRSFAGREEMRQLTKDEVLFHLGDLLAHMDGENEKKAERYFSAALAINSEHARAHAGLGNLATSASRYDSAMQHYERALALAPDDYLLCFQAASALMLRGQPGQADPAGPDSMGPSDLERAQELFRNAILGNPSFAEAYVGYGQTIVNGGGDVKAAIKLLEAGWHLLPGRSDLVVNLAVLHARNGDRDRARYLAREVLPAMGDPWALQAVRDLLDDLDAPAPVAEVGPSSPVAADPAREAPPSPDLDPSRFDPETQRVLDAIAEQARVDSATYNRQVEAYNRAVEMANGGALPEAIALLEDLLPQLRAADLQAQTRALLERMKSDLARLQGK
jgi:tetratricopeptide (TPR) repeat protein